MEYFGISIEKRTTNHPLSVEIGTFLTTFNSSMIAYFVLFVGTTKTDVKVAKIIFGEFKNERNKIELVKRTVKNDPNLSDDQKNRICDISNNLMKYIETRNILAHCYIVSDRLGFYKVNVFKCSEERENRILQSLSEEKMKMEKLVTDLFDLVSELSVLNGWPTNILI